MKKTLFLIVAAILGMNLSAQETYFPTKKGVVLIYDCQDNSNLSSGTKNCLVRYTVTEVENKDEDLGITYMIESVIPGKKEKLLLKEEGVVAAQSGDKFYFSLRDFVVMPNVKEIAPLSEDKTATGTSKITNKTSFTASIKLKSEYKTIKVTDGKVALPLQPTLEEQIPDTEMRIEWTEKKALQLSINLVKPSLSLSAMNFRIEAIDEEVTVKAGTFSCVRVSCDAKVAPMGFPAIGKTNTSYTHWYAKGVGLVKMESKGVIAKTMELIEVRE